MSAAAVPAGRLAVRPRCATCGRPASRVELVPPGELPADWASRSGEEQALFLRNRDPERWWFIYEGVESGNGIGNAVSVEEADRIRAAFAEPLAFDAIRGADLYDDAGFCGACGVAYCPQHWHVDRGGYGRCPAGHGKSLDPHWSPDDYD